MKIYLVRHAESEGNLSKFMIENSSLTYFGKEQAKRLSLHFKRLRIQKIFSSDLERAKLTSKEITRGIRKDVFYDKLLRERNWGEFYKKPREKIREAENKSGNEYTFRPNSGESLNDLLDRARKFLEILKKEKTERIVIVSHAGFIKAFFLVLFKLPLKEIKFINIKPASISSFTFSKKFMVSNFILGNMSHLIEDRFL